MLETTTEDVACTVCGCVCDDLRVTVRGGRIERAERACGLAEPWFLGQNESRPTAEIDGREAEIDDAVARAAAILREAGLRLFFGLSRSSTDGQRGAIALADRLGGTVDTTASLCHAPSILALQQVGESTCSLGEIRNRADLVIYWGCDPLASHPRHMERYSAEPRGLFVPRGRADRCVVVIDSEENSTAAAADVTIRVRRDRDFEALWTLRSLLAGRPVEPTCDTGAPLDDLVDLAERMKACRCGVVFFGLGLSRRGLGHLNVTALLSLVRDAHRHTRFHARRMRVQGDVTGADSVLCWQTGYPFSVNLSRGYPRYNPGEFSAQEMLERGDADAVLLLGSETIGQMSERAQRRLADLPTITLDHAGVAPDFTPMVRFTTRVYGIHEPGTAYRMDEMPIPLKGFLPSRYPSDAEVLGLIERSLEIEAI